MGRMMSESRTPVCVYVVDDDPAVVESTAFLARALGYECTTFASPEDLLAQLDGLAAGCVLSDLRMPKMSGYDLAVALRGKSIGWPLLLMSSENGPEVDRNARAHGFSAFLHKPLDSAMLAHALEIACATLAADRD
jgi:two-component system response regulator FixJ